MHTIWEVQNAILTLGHKTHAGGGDSMHYSHNAYEKIKLQRDIEYEISM